MVKRLKRTKKNPEKNNGETSTLHRRKKCCKANLKTRLNFLGWSSKQACRNHFSQPQIKENIDRGEKKNVQHHQNAALLNSET